MLADELCQGANEVVSILVLLVFHLLLGRTSACQAEVPDTELEEVGTDTFIGKECERSVCAIRSLLAWLGRGQLACLAAPAHTKTV
jgi:hypothetical protein